MNCRASSRSRAAPAPACDSPHSREICHSSADRRVAMLFRYPARYVTGTADAPVVRLDVVFAEPVPCGIGQLQDQSMPTRSLLRVGYRHANDLIELLTGERLEE